MQKLGNGQFGLYNKHEKRLLLKRMTHIQNISVIETWNIYVP